ncbi:DUF6502 family protein [Palleronia caenipelagi]|uniref:Uncharacterized protein n=1 Tax=Palleronia caenipelagi TaxID=2489174 RepID=A0A547PN17_9RHOB|nr:DUF6502 family protein [Palleronia caenipelagi]TRD15495.1 hypothetical protein FEV53_16085 [Palleronia caenipelagi]
MTTDPTRDPFASAMAQLLGPLAQAMVARGITVQEATEALKQALLDAAMDLDGATVSDSRISLRTGLHRKDVRRLRHQTKDAPPSAAMNAVAMVLSHWATTPEYQDADGAPLDLPREGTPGLYDVIRRTRVDMAPGTVLAALLDQGVVSELADGSYRLSATALIPTGESASMVAAYQATLSAHLQAATHNLIAQPGAERQFDRAVRYSHLSPASIEALSALATARAQDLLEDINAEARRLQERDANTNPSGHYAFGAYQMCQIPKEDEQ